MKISQDIWSELATLLKSKLLAKYNPDTFTPDSGKISSKLEIQHRGFYISIFDSKNDKLAQVGFLREGCTNVLESAVQALEGIYSELQAKGVSHKKLPTSSYNFTAVWDVVFLENSLAWDANTDGIYLNWGDRYKGMYLPSEIKQMSTTKAEVLNRLCSWELGVPSNLWRLPEGMTYKILCDSFSI